MKTKTRATFTTAVLTTDSAANIDRLQSLAKISKQGDCLIARAGDFKKVGLMNSETSREQVFMLKRSADKKMPWMPLSRLYTIPDGAIAYSDNDGGAHAVKFEDHLLYIATGSLIDARRFAPGADSYVCIKAADSVTERGIREHSKALCELAFAIVATSSHRREVYSGQCGEVIVGDDSSFWVGDLCYISNGLGWSHDGYMNAYGYTQYPGAEWRVAANATRRLRVHEFDGKFILVIGCGHDGTGPLGLGMDTGGISFVSTDRERIHRAAAACRDFLATPFN